MNKRIVLTLLAFCATMTLLTPLLRPGAAASAASFFFTTGEPDGRMAAASRPDSRKKIEIEAADDFILTSHTIIDRASFTGLLLHGGQGEIGDVVVEIYRVFPNDSDTTRTPRVPTRTNSPSDDAFTSRDSSDKELNFQAHVLAASFT